MLRRFKLALKKFWVTTILRRPWSMGWKWFGGYGVINRRIDDIRAEYDDGKIL